MRDSAVNGNITRKRLVFLASLLAGFFSASLAAGKEPGRAQASEGGVTVEYGVPRDCLLTLNITRPDGWIVRELLVAKKHTAGQHKISWDGRDNTGRILPAGEYRWRILTHDGIAWEYVTSIGNSGTPPWPTEDGTGGWGGNHGYPVAVAADSTGVYLGWSATEGAYSILKRTHDGTKGIWGSSLGAFEGVLALASNDQFLYAANKDRLLKIDRQTGAEILTAGLSTKKLEKDKEPLAPGGSVTFNFARDDQDGFVWGMAAGDSRVYVSNPWRNTIQVFTADSLEAVPAEDLAMRRPRGLALDGRGNLLVVSERRVLSVNLQTKAAKPLITSNLEAPFALARLPGGSLYIADLGTSHQVKKFSAAGQLVATFGRKGGGLEAALGGSFQTQDFRHPCALAALPDSSFWLAEDYIPKRVGRFSAEGQKLFEGFGSVNAAALTAPHPNDPGEVFSTMWGTFTSRVDYDQKTSTMSRILRPRWGSGGAGILEGDWGYSPHKLLSRDGRTYMWTDLGLFVVEADHLRPVMVVQALEESGRIADLARERGIQRRGWNTELMMWVDRNGDASAQLDEIQFVSLGEHGPYYFGYRGIGDDFTLFATYGFSWKPRGFSSAGVPLYEPADVISVPGFDPGRDYWLFGESPVRDGLGNFYHVINRQTAFLPRGQGFWSSRSSECFLRSFTPDWTPRWVIGQKARRAAEPGEMYYLFRNAGEMGECLFVSDVEGIVHIVHRDGFYVQSIMQDSFKQTKPGPDLLNVESFSGAVKEHPKTKKKYLYISSEQASHIFEIKGLESLSASAPKPVTIAGPVFTRKPTPDYRIKRAMYTRVVEGTNPNSEIDWMREVAPLPIYRDGRLVAEIRLLYDDSYLYVRADVLSGNGFVNHTPEEAHLPFAFEGGHTVELLLGVDPAANPARVKPVKGDQRIVYANTGPSGAGILVMQPVAAGSNARQFTYEGRGGKATLGNIEFLAMSSGAVKVDVDTPIQNNGYVLQMAIPIEQLLLPEQKLSGIKGKRLRFDAAIVSPEAAGRVKAYWKGGNPAMLVTNDRAVEAQLYPDGWGNAIFDDSPAPAGSNVVEAERATGDRQIDGGDWEWTAQAETRIEGSSGPVARFRTAWDDQNFYASILVIDSTPLTNGSGSPELIIKGGDAVGFCFGAPGLHQKIVFADVGGEHVNMAYRPRWRVKKPYTFSSPVSSVTLEYVGAINSLSKPHRLSESEYWLEVAIPWTELGITPKAGMQVPFDVQVIFSDDAGTRNTYNAWWHSRSVETQATFDLPTEARLYPNLWGKLILK
ncbi:MAG: hypothetical protein M3463_00070 [Verrucomicrobiota bacterium]|nr:hypothetical protein [Verrucomicrobiota bacterium]